METKNNVYIDEWNESIEDLHPKIRFLDKEQTVYAIKKCSIQMAQEFKMVKCKLDQWITKCAHSSDEQICS